MDAVAVEHGELAADVVAGDGGGEEVAAGGAGLLGNGEEGGKEGCAGVGDGLLVGVVEVHTVREGPVEESGQVRRELARLAEDGAGARRVGSDGRGAVDDGGVGLGEGAAAYGAAEEVQE